MQEERYLSHLEKRHAGLPFVPSTPLQRRGRKAVSTATNRGDYSVPVPENLDSVDPLGLDADVSPEKTVQEDSDWEKEPEEGFLILDDPDRTPIIPLVAKEAGGEGTSQEVICGMPQRPMVWKLIPVDITRDDHTRDPRLIQKKCKKGN